MFPGIFAGSGGVSSKSAPRSLVEPVAATRLPTICCVDLVTFLTVEAVTGGFEGSAGDTALVVSGELLGGSSKGLSLPSAAPTAERNQPLTRDWTGEESGVGDSEGKDVRLLSSAAEGDGVRPKEVLELRFSGRIRPGPALLFVVVDADEFWELVRTRSTAPSVSGAAILVFVFCEDAHPPRREEVKACGAWSGGRGQAVRTSSVVKQPRTEEAICKLRRVSAQKPVATVEVCKHSSGCAGGNSRWVARAAKGFGQSQSLIVCCRLACLPSISSAKTTISLPSFSPIHSPRTASPCSFPETLDSGGCDIHDTPRLLLLLLLFL